MRISAIYKFFGLVAIIFWVTGLLFLKYYRSNDILYCTIAESSANNIYTGDSIYTRFNPPKGYYRIAAPSSSYTMFLRELHLKPVGSLVKTYDDGLKYNQDIHEAVIDLPIGSKDLHQCADAVMRLRAEHLWRQGSYDRIHFNLTNGQQIDYSKWMQGYRVDVEGNKTNWVKKTDPSNSYSNFWNYMELIFMYAGTYSLSKELMDVSIKEMEVGDVFIQGGFPGHACVVVDMAQREDGAKVYMLAQSFMPAQELHVLKNMNDSSYSPWYELNNTDQIIRTPEWTFSKDDLHRFRD